MNIKLIYCFLSLSDDPLFAFLVVTEHWAVVP